MTWICFRAELVHNIVQLLRSWNGLVFLSMPTISGSCSLCCSMNWIISCMVRETGRRWTSDSTLSCSTSFLAACRFDIVAMVTVVWQNDRRWKFSLWLVFYLLPCDFVLGACGIDPSLLWEDTWYQSPNHKVVTWTWNEDTQHSLLLNNIHIQNSNNGKRKRPQRCAKLSYWTVITLASLKFFCKAGKYSSGFLLLIKELFYFFVQKPIIKSLTLSNRVINVHWTCLAKQFRIRGRIEKIKYEL